MERKKFLEQIANSEGTEKIEALMKYSRYLQQIDPEESAKQAKIVLEIAREQNNAPLEVRAIINIANASFNKSDIPETEHWLDLLLRKGTKNKIVKAMGTAYSLKARIALSQNNATLSLQNMLLALEQYQKENNQFDLLSCYNGLGIIHLMKTELDEAYHYFMLALKIAEDIKHNAKHSIRVNIGIIQREQKKYKEALESNFISLEYFRENDQKTSEATALYNIGFCYYQLKELAISLTYLEKSYALSKEMNEKYLLSKRCNAIAITLVKLGKLDEALPLIEEAVKLANKYDLQWDLALGYETFSLYYKHTEDYKQAYEYLAKVLILKEKITKENNQEKIADLEAKYKTQIYKSQNTALDEKNKAMSDQINILNKSLQDINDTHQKLKIEFQKAVKKMNTQDDILSSQARMAVMGEMISSIAHQWRQPLNIISILSQSIGDAWDYDELNEEFLEKQIEHITGQINYMNETIDDFRNFFKPEFVSEFSVEEIINKSISLVSSLLKKSDIILKTEIASNCKLNGNPNELMQVIINIINNAREAMVRNSVTDPTIIINVCCDSQEIFIKIFNRGNQIKDEHLKKLFEPYFTTRGSEGTGIGLHICRLIIENKFHGSIKAVNKSDGVEFEIKLPSEIIHD